MALPRTKTPIKPKKLKKQIFAKSWGRGASKSWKRDYQEKRQFRKGLVSQ